MNKTTFLLTACLAMSMCISCGSKSAARSEDAPKINRHILGEELAFGKRAAKYELWNEAIFRWERVVENDPSNAQATNNLAVAYESVGNFEKAEALYKKAIAMNEDSKQVRQNYRRFTSFYKKHKLQLAREKRRVERAKAQSKQAEAEKGDE